MGRPRKTVDSKRVIELAAKGHTLEEIAALENISHDTLQRRFACECEKGRRLCAAQIRAKQVEKALAGNGDTTMLIWLGKQLLGQRDKQEMEYRGTIEHSVAIEQGRAFARKMLEIDKQSRARKVLEIEANSASLPPEGPSSNVRGNGTN